MRHNAIIYNTEFLPREGTNSSLLIWAVIPKTNEIASIEAIGTIKSLSELHEFDIISDMEWDLNKMYKRDCIIEYKDEIQRFVFISY